MTLSRIVLAPDLSASSASAEVVARLAHVLPELAPVEAAAAVEGRAAW